MLGNWIKQETTTTGTGSITLSAVTGFPTFNNHPVFSAGAPFYYSVLDADGLPIETGIGHLSDSTTLVRDKILASYVSGTYDNASPSAVSLASGTKKVICAGGADAFVVSAPGMNANASLAPAKFLPSAHLTSHSGSSGGITLTANRLYVEIFELTTQIECDALVIRVGTGASGKLVRLGLYAVGADGHPGALIGETGNLSVTNSGDIVGTIAAPIRLPPGVYATAAVSDGTPACGVLSFSGGLRATQCFGVSSSNMMLVNRGFYASHTFGALPNPAPTTSLTAVNGTMHTPSIYLRAV